jgi:hypothetical protein
VYGEKKNTCRVLVGKPQEKRQLGRPRHRQETKMDLKYKMYQDRNKWQPLTNRVMNLQLP